MRLKEIKEIGVSFKAKRNQISDALQGIYSKNLVRVLSTVYLILECVHSNHRHRIFPHDEEFATFEKVGRNGILPAIDKKHIHHEQFQV